VVEERVLRPDIRGGGFFSPKDALSNEPGYMRSFLYRLGTLFEFVWTSVFMILTLLAGP